MRRPLVRLAALCALVALTLAACIAFGWHWITR